MRRPVLSLFTFFTLAGMLVANSSQGAAGDRVEYALKAYYRYSHVEIQNPRTEGHVRDLGAVLTLQDVGVPANKFYVIEPQPAAAKPFGRRIHKFNYAPVEIGEDGRLTPARADFTLPQGTRLVVLDLKVEADRVRLSTHTLEPVRVAGGEAAYGCTEFAFRLDPTLLERGDLAAIQRRIDQWLSLTETTPQTKR